MLNQTRGDATTNKAHGTMIRVCGYGPANQPFYKEAVKVAATSDRFFLILNASVSCGQKLLLMDESEPDLLEGEILKMRSVNGRMVEVEVALTR